MLSQKFKFVKLWVGLECLQLKNQKKNAHMSKISTTMYVRVN